MSSGGPRRILGLAGLFFVIAMAGCAHLDWTPLYEGQLPEPTDPAYPAEVLKARAKHIREVRRWQLSLDTLNRLIELRRAGRIVRDPSGRIVETGEDHDLQRWRFEMERDLSRAQSALYRLERKVRADFEGEFPPWWPRDNG